MFHGREEGVPLAPSTVTSRMGCGFHKTLDRGSQKETQRSVLGRHHHFCLSMSGDFDFAITSPSLMRSLCGQVQSFQSAVCASSSSVPNLQGRAHSEGAGLAPLKGPFLITLVSGSPGWPQTHYVIKDDLELVILLPPLPGAGTMHVYSHTLFLQFMGIEPRASCLHRQVKPQPLPTAFH